MHDEERTFALSCYAKARNHLVHMGSSNKETVKDNKDTFPDGLCSKARMQFPSQILLMLTTRRNHTTEVIMCKTWSPRLCPYPSLAQKMQTYLELMDPEPSPNQPDKSNAPLLQKAPVPTRPANKKKRRNRSKEANRRQFKVRLIEKPLIPSNEATSPKPKTMTTTMTVTQSSRTNPIMPSVTWPTAKTTKLPLTIYNVPSARIQETPDSSRPLPRPKPQGRERTPIPGHKISPIEQQPATLIPKTTATATPASNVHGSTLFWHQQTNLSPDLGH